MRALLVICTLLLPAVAHAQQIDTFRHLASTVAMDLVATDVDPPRQSDSDEVFGPSSGPWSEIISSTVNDPAPEPSGGAVATASQVTDLVFSEGNWVAGGDGFTRVVGEVIAGPDTFGSYSNADGFSFFSATVQADSPVAARLDAELESHVFAAHGTNSHSFRATVSVCEDGGWCQVDLLAMATPGGPDPDRVAFHGPLQFRAGGTYRVRFTAISGASASAPGSKAEGIAQWSGTLTVPEPSGMQLGLVAVLVLAAMRGTAESARRRGGLLSSPHAE